MNKLDLDNLEGFFNYFGRIYEMFHNDDCKVFESEIKDGELDSLQHYFDIMTKNPFHEYLYNNYSEFEDFHDILEEFIPFREQYEYLYVTWLLRDKDPEWDFLNDDIYTRDYEPIFEVERGPVSDQEIYDMLEKSYEIVSELYKNRMNVEMIRKAGLLPEDMINYNLRDYF